MNLKGLQATALSAVLAFVAGSGVVSLVAIDKIDAFVVESCSYNAATLVARERSIDRIEGLDRAYAKVAPIIPTRKWLRDRVKAQDQTRSELNAIPKPPDCKTL